MRKLLADLWRVKCRNQVKEPFWRLTLDGLPTAMRMGGRTIIVLGSGLARPYPSDHVELFDQAARMGSAVISELSPWRTAAVRSGHCDGSTLCSALVPAGSSRA